MCRVAQEPENFELVHTFMMSVLLDPASPLGELCTGFGTFLLSRYKNASSNKALDEAATCVTLGAKRVHGLALTILPVLSMPTPMLSAMEAIRDKIFEHAGGCLMEGNCSTNRDLTLQPHTSHQISSLLEVWPCYKLAYAHLECLILSLAAAAIS